jgi:hypothetical protein
VITVLAARVRAVWGNPRLVRAAAIWGLWVGGEAGLLVPLSVSAFSRGGTTAGDCFGEIAALQRSPRTATVMSLSDSHLLTIIGNDVVFAVTGFKPAEYAAKALVDQRLNPRASD